MTTATTIDTIAMLFTIIVTTVIIAMTDIIILYNGRNDCTDYNS